VQLTLALALALLLTPCAVDTVDTLPLTLLIPCVVGIVDTVDPDDVDT